GVRVVPLDVERKSLAPLEGIRNFARARKIVRAERPDIVHCIALRPVVVGGIAARLAGAKSLVLAPTGLGHSWTEEGVSARLVRSVIRVTIARLRGPNTRFLFETRETRGDFPLDPGGGPSGGGAGVDPANFPWGPGPPSPPVKVAVVSRMIAAKGIADAVEAARRARALGAAIELHL